MPSRRALMAGATSTVALSSVMSGLATAVDPVSAAEQLLYLTVRIVGRNASNQEVGGTGFFYRVYMADGNFTTLLITNQHVIRDTVGGVDIRIHTRTAATGAPDGVASIHLDGGLADEWIVHPSNLDLCAYPIQPKLNMMTNPGAFLAYLQRELIPSAQALADLDAIEEIIMVGYPALLYDQQNNYPIIRRGITATHPAVDFDGRPETAIDTSVIGGSSGSPVLIYYLGGSQVDKRGNTYVGKRHLLFLGVLWGGVESTKEGMIQITEAPITLPGNSTTITGKFGYAIPINIGYIIKSREILPLADAVLQKFGQKGI